MGNSQSDETDAKIKIEVAERKRKEAEKNLADEKRQKEEIQKKLTAEYEKQKKQHEKEVEEESRKNLEATEKKMASYKQRKADGAKRLENLENELEANINKMIEETKTLGVMQVANGKEQLKKDNEKLVREREHLVFEMNRMQEVKQENLKEEEKKKEEMREKEAAREREHKQEILKMTEKMGEVELDGQKRLNKLTEDHAEFQKTIAADHLQVKEQQMKDAYSLMDAQKEEQSYENFRRNCRRMIDLYNIVKMLLEEEESYLISTKDEIELGITVSMAPDFSTALRSLVEFSSELEGFRVDGATDPATFEALAKTVKEIADKLLKAIRTTVSQIRSYQRACDEALKKSDDVQDPTQEEAQNEENQQKIRLVSMTPSESDEFEVLSTSSQKVESPKKLAKNVAKKPHEKASELFNISKLYEEMNDLIRNLSEEVMKFNVRASTKFDQVLSLQYTSPSIRRQEHAQIQAAPTSSRQAAVEHRREEDESVVVEVIEE